MTIQTNAIHLAGRFLERANDTIARALEREGLGDDILPSHGDIFNVLFHAPEGLGVRALAERTHRSKSTVSVLTDRLEKRGYLTKIRDEQDARLTVLRLTEKGRALQPVFARITEDLMAGTTRYLTETEVRTLEALLTKARDGLAADERP